ncbi:diguanylate cyclase [Geopsychrobacter electrodiphilus]|uniref:diguanylate cyclase n=1 Tax=Geopsychrobacter electrodiphilus TaxID=225196 RepID=UPI00037395F4|nr:diguanylate cyclase [Geopsychrobacter electrodiphilus]
MKKGIFSRNYPSSPRSSVKREIFQSSALLALIVVAVFSVFLSTILYYSEISKAQAVINRTNRAVTFSLKAYFTEIINTIKVLDENKEVRDAMSLGNEARQRIRDEYRSFSNANSHITYLYSGYKNGLMLINDYTLPAGFDPTSRPWYQAAMAIKPETSIGLPYRDISTQEWLVSTSRALKNSAGEYGGVVSIDCSFEQISQLIAQPEEYKTEYSFVMDRSGNMVIHPDPALMGKSLQKMAESIRSANQGDFTYQVNNVTHLAHYNRVASTGWTVVTLVDKSEILRPIITKMLLLVGLIGVMAVLLGFVQGVLLSRRLSQPLVELGRKIKATIAGEVEGVAAYVYPNNEIGIMAREIGQLAEKALIAKTQELQASEEIYKSILMASPDDITIADLAGRIIMFSDAAPEMFGYSPEEGVGMLIMDFIHPEDHARARANIVKLLQDNHTGPNEYRAIRKDGRCFDIEVKNALIRDRQGNPYRMVLIIRDITSRKQTEQQIQLLVQQLELERDLAQRNSLTDSLTGLPNRRFFDNALRAEFSRHQRSGSQLSLIMLDVDHFKKYNDHYGHPAGDDCLRQIAQTLKAVVERESDFIARYGGEEFVVILADTSLQGALALAARISKAVSKLALAHARSDVSDFVTISLGIATAADHVLNDGSQLVSLADQGMYQAKMKGRNRCEVMPPPS